MRGRRRRRTTHPMAILSGRWSRLAVGLAVVATFLSSGAVVSPASAATVDPFVVKLDLYADEFTHAGQQCGGFVDGGYAFEVLGPDRRQIDFQPASCGNSVFVASAVVEIHCRADGGCWVFSSELVVVVAEQGAWVWDHTWIAGKGWMNIDLALPNTTLRTSVVVFS
jgi:hypothetical protein